MGMSTAMGAPQIRSELSMVPPAPFQAFENFGNGHQAGLPSSLPPGVPGLPSQLYQATTGSSNLPLRGHIVAPTPVAPPTGVGAATMTRPLATSATLVLSL